MSKKFTSPNSIYRIIDANINRVKEGLRVCEEITRFILNNYRLTTQIKAIRHQLQGIFNKLPVEKLSLLCERDSIKDVGKHITGKEKTRSNFQDILFANMQRVKESLRVLEEFSKLMNKKLADKIKNIRYDIYDLEKKIAQKL